MKTIDFVILTPQGYLTWNDEKAKIAFTPNIENAALFNSDNALDMQTRIDGAAIMNTSGELMMLEDMTDDFQVTIESVNW